MSGSRATQRALKATVELKPPSALDVFVANPTPANAVRLAIGDHKANERGIDWHFVAALERAAIVLEGNAPVPQ